MSACVSSINYDMDVTTALTLVIPDEFHEQINEIRQKYDKAFPRWMPHINFLFPFVGEENFNTIHKQLQIKLQDFGSFNITFDKITFFKQKKMNTYNLQPNDDDQLQKLFSMIRECLPEINVKHPEFHPHMTLGQAKHSDHEEFFQELTDWLSDGFTFSVQNICLIKRNGNDPFTVRLMVNL